MLSIKLLQSGLEDLKNITRADFYLCDSEGDILIDTAGKGDSDRELIEGFISSSAESQNIKGAYYQKIIIDSDTTFVLVVYAAGNDGYMLSRIAASEIIHLVGAHKGKQDKEEFYRDLLLDNILPADIERRIKSLKLKDGVMRTVYSIMLEDDFIEPAMELLKNIFPDSKEDVILHMDDNRITIIKSFDGDEIEDEILANAELIVSMINTELMAKVKVTYGRKTREFRGLSELYRESVMALEVVNIFYEERNVASYTSLGIGRLIHQLPRGLCNLFLNEVLGENANKLTKEDIAIIDKFFENSLNVAETAREIKINRTTLIYKIEKINNKIELDIRKFEDALVLKIAMMVAKYIDYLENKK